jgi:pimeloyl-ACP methyl ester carboxylesterase
MTTVHHRYATVNGQRLFYREAGPPGAPAVLLLHGFPASSSLDAAAGHIRGFLERTLP